jgi:hypothetical protein
VLDRIGDQIEGYVKAGVIGDIELRDRRCQAALE